MGSDCHIKERIRQAAKGLRGWQWVRKTRTELQVRETDFREHPIDIILERTTPVLDHTLEFQKDLGI